MSFSLKTAVFSCAILLALFSCSNFGGDSVQDAAGFPAQGGSHGGTSQGGGLFYKTISGSVALSGIFPRGFGGNTVAAQKAADGTDGADCVPKTIFPAADSVDSSALEYFVTASHAGLSDIAGTVTEDGGVLTYSITLPFSSATDSWSVAVTGKDGDGKILLSSQAVAVKASDAEKDIALSYAQDPSGDTGTVSFDFPVASDSGIQSAVVTFGADAAPTVGVYGGKVSFSKSGVAPGSYAIKIVFFGGTSASGDVLYAINEVANVYSNLTTSVPFGNAEYITSGSAFKTISKGMVSAMQSVEEGGIWLGGTGITGSAASDDNSGTKFKPVATLWRAVEIANALAAKDATKTYEINVQGNVRAGTDDAGGVEGQDPEIAAATKVVIKGTNSTSYWTISGYDGSDPCDFVTSNSAAATFQYLAFDKLTGFEVAAGKVTINDCQVTNGASDENGISGGVTVDADAEFVSEQGLKITACENSAGAKSGVAGGGGGIWSAGTVDLTGAEISACGATGTLSCGGGIFAKAGTVSLKNCVVDGNSSISGGAGIYVVAASLSVDADTSVTGNSASGSSSTGGGLYVTSSCSEPITLAGTFCGNSANSGGAVYNSSAADFTIGSGAVIGKEGEGNTAAIGGGVYHSGSVELKMTGGTIAYNTATTNGAGFCMMSGKTATISGGSISNNECTGSGTNGKGGGVYSNGTLYLTGGTISANSSLRGGGVYNDSSGKFFMYGDAVIGGSSSAYGNKALGTNCFGGGVFNAGSCYFGYSAWSDSGGTPKAWTGRVSANSSEDRGGGVYNAGDFKMISGMIGGATDAYANTAANLGGALYGGGGKKISFGGSASIPPASDGGNDICLNNAISNAISLTSKLTADAVVGLITVGPNTSEERLSGDDGVNAITSTDVTGTDFESCVAKFKVKQVKKYLLALGKTGSNAGVIKKDKTYDENYIVVQGTKFTGTAVSGSSVFISGRKLTIPTLHVCVHEVTQKQYSTYCKFANPSGLRPDSRGLGDNYPAYFIDWYDCIVYCNLRSIAEGLEPCYKLGTETNPKLWSGTGGNDAEGYYGPQEINTAWNAITCDFSANGWRMLRDVEWEYLAREGNLTGAQKLYSGSDDIEAVGWYTLNSSGKTYEVKTKDANALGIYNMTGNVWEYIWDWSGTITSSTSIDGPTSSSSGKRMVRGGGFNSSADDCKIGSHGVQNPPTDSWANCGVRVARTLD